MPKSVSGYDWVLPPAQEFSGKCFESITIRKGFKEMSWNLLLYAKVLRTIC